MSVPLSPEVEAKLTALETAARIERMGTCGTPHANEVCKECQDVQRQCEHLARSAYALSQWEIVRLTEALHESVNDFKETQMSEQIPSIGRIVHYRLSADDAAQIMRRRTTGNSIADRMRLAGAQAYIGNDVEEGDTFPMLIVRVWGQSAESAVNGQVFLDGNDWFWATSRTVGDQSGTFSWPVRA